MPTWSIRWIVTVPDGKGIQIRAALRVVLGACPWCDQEYSTRADGEDWGLSEHRIGGLDPPSIELHERQHDDQGDALAPVDEVLAPRKPVSQHSSL